MKLDENECLISISKAQSKIDNTQDNPIVALPLVVKLEQDGAVLPQTGHRKWC